MALKGHIGLKVSSVKRRTRGDHSAIFKELHKQPTLTMINETIKHLFSMGIVQETESRGCGEEKDTLICILCTMNHMPTVDIPTLDQAD